MKLSELIGGMSPSVFTKISLIIAVSTFAIILFYAFARRNRALFDRARSLPLNDGAPIRQDTGELS